MTQPVFLVFLGVFFLVAAFVFVLFRVGGFSAPPRERARWAFTGVLCAVAIVIVAIAGARIPTWAVLASNVAVIALWFGTGGAGA